MRLLWKIYSSLLAPVEKHTGKLKLTNDLAGKITFFKYVKRCRETWSPTVAASFFTD